MVKNEKLGSQAHTVEDLAFEFCEKNRNGEDVKMQDYLRRLANKSAKAAFKELVNTDMLLTVAARHHASTLFKSNRL